MPTVWRYLLKQYMKVLALAVATFILVLFVSRAKQIAEFAAMGAGANAIGLFAVYLIPYVLPYAVPVSCLLASIVLFQRLSNTQELTAMRACGLALRQITGPLLLAGAVLALFNFFIASELATHSHMLGRRMEAHLSSVNPLHLLQNTRLLKMGDIFVDMRTLKAGEEAEEMTLALYNRGSGRLNLFTADRLALEGEVLHADNVNVLTTVSAEGDGFDHLLVENQGEMSMPTSSLGQLIHRVGLHLKHSHLRLRLLLVRIHEEQKILAENPTRTDLATSIARGRSEIVRRISLGLSAFTFTLMGCTFGIHVSRRQTRKGIIAVVALSALFIAAYSVAGGLDSRFSLATTLYLLPHAAIIPLCILTLKRVTRGATA
jgi:lipopolysaccharide export system permease protein